MESIRAYLKKENNWFFIPLALISILVLTLNRTGPLEGHLRPVGFILFIILCISLIVICRHSKWKIAVILLYFIFFGLIPFLD
ncbi:hypothetical protein D1B31_01685 [Neobacillus notoginsengisoli]|uniref:Uncharacterized protein n=1 Tax=Neobacillus notoginsengisoli TaxID=1578198 RepID=A0A417YZR2_9BACI|nr:hypothetical protein D1B31_01685 [Neobacillus notoginsengisoli]